jgi:hypothetical protein
MSGKVRPSEILSDAAESSAIHRCPYQYVVS